MHAIITQSTKSKDSTKMAKKQKIVSAKLQLLVATGTVLLLTTFGLFIGWLDASAGSSSDDSVSVTIQDITLKGEQTCLEHVSDGPTTMECAMGIKLPHGDVYAIKGDVPPTTDNKLEVTGTLTAPADTSTYKSDGTLTIKK
jgi:hypothetical protein